MSTPVYQLPHRYSLTVEEFHRMGDAGIFRPNARTELIDGEIIEMAPIGAPHAGITKRLIDIFARQIGNRAIIDAQDPVTLGTSSQLQPDIVLLRPREDFYVKSHPCAEDILLLIEIADTTLTYDRDTKIPLYARAGVREVWLIDIHGRHLDVYRQPEEGRYTTQKRALDIGRIGVEALSDVTFDLTKLFDGI